MLLLLRNLWKCAKRKSALHLAHVVLQDITLREGLREMETVFNLEGLADWPLLRACTHRARRDTLSVTDLDRRVPDVAL